MTYTCYSYDSQVRAESRSERPTPAGIAVLCTLIVEAGLLLGTYAGMVLALAAQADERAAGVLGAFFTTAAILSFITAWGLWHVRRWGLILALVLSALVAILAFVCVFLGSAWMLGAVAFELIIIRCLWVRRGHFGHRGGRRRAQEPRERELR